MSVHKTVYLTLDFKDLKYLYIECENLLLIGEKNQFRLVTLWLFPIK